MTLPNSYPEDMEVHCIDCQWRGRADLTTLLSGDDLTQLHDTEVRCTRLPVGKCPECGEDIYPKEPFKPYAPRAVLTARRLIEQLQEIIKENADEDANAHGKDTELVDENGVVDYTIVFESAQNSGPVGQAYLEGTKYVPSFHDLPHIVLKGHPDIDCD